MPLNLTAYSVRAVFFTNLKTLRAVALALLCFAFVTSAFANEEITVTVGAEQRQTFKGFGANMVLSRFLSIAGDYYLMPQDARDKTAALAWGTDGADFRFLRIWLDYTELNKISTMAGRYRPVIEDILKVQPNLTVLFTSYTKYIATRYMAPIPIDWYTTGFAKAVKDLRDQGIPIAVVEVANEPNDHNICTDPDSMVQLIKRFREELDNQGLEHVKLIGPSSGSVDDVHWGYLHAIANDSAALGALDGISAHTYNMGANPEMVQWSKKTGLEYWQTESSVDQPDWHSLHSERYRTGSIMAGKILGDLNHYVSHWLFFCYYMAKNRYGTSLFYGTDTGIDMHMQFNYVNQISNIFDVGASFRYCLSDKNLPRKSMDWQYGQKPAVAVAAAQNPDGSYGIGVVNTTGNEVTDTYDGAAVGWSYPAATYDVTIVVEELAHADTIRFSAWRTNAAVDNAPDAQPVIMLKGAATLTLEAHELVTLRGFAPVNTREAPATAQFSINWKNSRLAIPFKTHGRLSIIDARGRNAGSYLFTGPTELAMNDLAAGMYVVRYQCPAFEKTFRILKEK